VQPPPCLITPHLHSVCRGRQHVVHHPPGAPPAAGAADSVRLPAAALSNGRPFLCAAALAAAGAAVVVERPLVWG
jgi:hypothetical protein